jgi:hypothetical protein
MKKNREEEEEEEEEAELRWGIKMIEEGGFDPKTKKVEMHDKVIIFFLLSWIWSSYHICKVACIWFTPAMHPAHIETLKKKKKKKKKKN